LNLGSSEIRVEGQDADFSGENLTLNAGTSLISISQNPEYEEDDYFYPYHSMYRIFNGGSHTFYNF